MNEKNFLTQKAAQKIFEEATTMGLGSTFHVIISFHLKNKFNKNPCEMLVENPKSFYDGLKEVLGEGADAVLILIGTYLITKYNMNYNAEEFAKLFTRDRQPAEQKLIEIFQKAVKQE